MTLYLGITVPNMSVLAATSLQQSILAFSGLVDFPRGAHQNAAWQTEAPKSARATTLAQHTFE